MKKWIFALWLALFAMQSYAQNRPFRGNFYVGTEAGIFTSRTRMVAGDLGKYRTGNSGLMFMQAVKLGYSFNPYFSIETGLHTYPTNLVYLYDKKDAWIPTPIGATSLKFSGVPLRAIGRVYILHKKLEATVSGGLGYIDTHNSLYSRFFQGSQRIGKDTLAYFGETQLLRRYSVYGELGVGLNWAFSRRWQLSVQARQLMGLLNVAKVKVAIKQNHDAPNQAEFVGSGSGLNIGVGLKYQFRLLK